MAYFVKTISGAELFKSETAITVKEALQEAVNGGADLRSADLRGAYLGGADLGEQWIIQGQTRSDGYAFFLQRLKDDTEPMIKAGCRHFTIADAQKHWETTRKGEKLLDETRAIVRAMVDVMHIRGAEMNYKHSQELARWQRRDVTIDFVCSIFIMCGGAFMLACLL